MDCYKCATFDSQPSANSIGALHARTERVILIGLFSIAILVHLFLATRNWQSTFMLGHEFRQAQTAIVSHHIDKESNFSLLYETPILGKPWVSILLEVPFYQWSVVGLSRATGWPHLESARTISLICFYLALPSLYLLLGRLAIDGLRRLLVLTLVLTTPVYIFYSRAFLMESMVLMCCAWFLLGFVRTMDRRDWRWLLLTIVAGTGAALIKSITYAVWLLPAAAYGAWLLGRDIWPLPNWRQAAATISWGLATVVVPLGSLRAWILYTDPLKQAHASAYIFSSKNLSLGNWGLFDLKAAFGPSTWLTLFERWREALMSPWIVWALLGCGLLFFSTMRQRILGMAAVFFGAQLLFPFAYAYQDYYFYACAVFLSGALGAVLIGALDSKLPRWAFALLVALPIAAQLSTYWKTYREWQLSPGHGGYPYTQLLAELTPPNSVIIVAGNDWAAMVPLYAQRRALMVRNGLQYDRAYLARAFSELEDEDVSALVVTGELRYHREFIEMTAEAFGFDPSRPTFSNEPSDIYIRRIYEAGVLNRLRVSSVVPEIVIHDTATMPTPVGYTFDIPPAVARTTFGNILPAPFRGYFQFGLDHTEVDGSWVISAHPDADLWLRVPGPTGKITWEFGFMPPAYERDGDRTDGVEFLVASVLASGEEHVVFRRVLTPTSEEKDRGLQREEFAYAAEPGEVLRFSTRANGSYSYDWVYWRRIIVR
jgi:hypothetical protein